MTPPHPGLHIVAGFDVSWHVAERVWQGDGKGYYVA
jgi:hypothetical protein